MKPRTCDVTSCPLHGGRPISGVKGIIEKVSKPVWGAGSSSPICMLIGEAPGADEESYGVPFVGKSGQELTMYLTRFSRITRDRCWVTNLIKCRPPKNRDPHKDEIESCEDYITIEIAEKNPSVIGTVGRVATQWLLETKVTMERVHGIPFRWDGVIGKSIVVPLYHPAYGLHSPRRMKDVIEDFTALGRVIRGQLKPRQEGEMELDYKLEEGA